MINEENQVQAHRWVVIYGIWAKEPIQVTIFIGDAILATLTNGVILYDKLIIFREYMHFEVDAQYLVPCRKKPEFSFLGYAIEPKNTVSS